VKDLEILRKALAARKAAAGELAKTQKTDYDAGVYEGLKEALAMVDRQLDKGMER
jgi:hypothetical protein